MDHNMVYNRVYGQFPPSHKSSKASVQQKSFINYIISFLLQIRPIRLD
jgi:hypothetical protein